MTAAMPTMTATVAQKEEEQAGSMVREFHAATRFKEKETCR
jgi:hypothetical protein